MAKRSKSSPVVARKLFESRRNKALGEVLYRHIHKFSGSEADSRRITGKGRAGDPEGNGHTPRG